MFFKSIVLWLVSAFKYLNKFMCCILRQLFQIWPCPNSGPICRNCEDIFYTKDGQSQHKDLVSLYEMGDMKNRKFYLPFSRGLISLIQLSEPSCLFLLIRKKHSALLRLSSKMDWFQHFNDSVGNSHTHISLWKETFRCSWTVSDTLIVNTVIYFKFCPDA